MCEPQTSRGNTDSVSYDTTPKTNKQKSGERTLKLRLKYTSNPHICGAHAGTL